MSEAIVRAEKVTRVLPGPVPVTLVADVDLSIDPGELVAITGPSGSGKSSLLYLLGLLDRPTSGRVLVAGTDTGVLDDGGLAEMRLTKLGFVFQFHFLLPEFSVQENVMIPMRKHGALSEPQMRQRAQAVLSGLGLGESLRKRPDQLSGGQRQRVAIARALANDPLLVLADEPTGNLDSRNGRMVFDIFASLARQGRAVVVVTHDQDLAAMCSRRVHLVDGRLVSDERGGTAQAGAVAPAVVPAVVPEEHGA